MIRICKIFFAAALLFAISFSTQTFAQVDAGRLTGTVTDQSGAAIANASIVAHNINTGLERTDTSNSAGTFTMPGIPTGIYKVTVTSGGFSPFNAQVEVTIGGNISVDAKLGVQGANAQVEVTISGIAEINTTTPEVA